MACEALVYPGLKATRAAPGSGGSTPWPSTGRGLRADALEAAFRAGIRLAVVSPTLHNPTTATMGLERRKRLVELARKHDAILIEEDVYGLLREEAPPPLVGPGARSG